MNIEEPKNIKLLNYDKNNNFLFDKNEEIGEYFDIYINNNKINYCFEYNFKEIGKYQIKINWKKKLINTKNIFFDCCSLTSLNLSNFNTNNVTNMSNMFYGCSSLKKENVKINKNEKKIIKYLPSD